MSLTSKNLKEKVSPKDLVKIKTVSGSTKKGRVIPDKEFPEKIVLKLDNGYNTVFKAESISEIEVLQKNKSSKTQKKPSKKVEKEEGKKDILVLHTGGTIASRVSYEEGGVKPGFSAEDLLEMYPEIFRLANIESEVVAQMLSEDMEPSHWQQIAEKVYSKINDFDGVIISHGTDTMQHTASALSFMLENLDKPVVLVGSQRSSDRPSSDSAQNLEAAVKFVCEDVPGVFVCMHETSNDDKVAIHRGVRVRKMHSSRRDAFKTVGGSPFAVVDLEKESLEVNGEFKTTKKELKLKKELETNVGYLKVVPGMSKEDIERFKESEGVLIEGTGLGHLPVNSFDEHTEHHEEILNSLESICEDTLVGMATQCIGGRVNMDVYDSGLKIKNAGVVSSENMLPETAYVKMMWVLGNTGSLEDAKKLFKQNLAGEIIGSEHL